MWIRSTGGGRAYSLGDLFDAATFSTYEEAQDAISSIPPVFGDSGFRFSVEDSAQP
jgi:hypothetical protein